MDAISKLAAIEEIRQLKARYFRYVDTREWDRLAEVFSADAVFDYSKGNRLPGQADTADAPGPVIRSREEIVQWIREAFTRAISVHHGHCHEIAIDSDTEAHGVIALESWTRGPDRKTQLAHGAGHYHERYVVEDGAWRIAETRLTRLSRDPAG